MLRLSLIFLCLCITQIRSDVTTRGPEVSTHKLVDCNGKKGFFKDSTNPHKFHECVNGKVEDFTCPESLVFDEAKERCDFDSSVVTNPSTVGTTGKVTKPSTVGTTEKVTKPSTVGTTEKVTKPSTVGTTEKETKPPTVGTTEKVTKPPTVGTTEKVTKPPTVGTTGKSKADCNEKTRLFKDSTNPHKFHECVNGKVEDFTCPENLVFDEAKSVCDFDSSVVTNPSTVGTTGKVTKPSTVGTTGKVTKPSTVGTTGKVTEPSIEGVFN